MEVYKYSWAQFHRDCNSLLKQVEEKEFKSVAGIAFGGLSLLTCLKNKLNLPARIIFASSYVWGKQQKRDLIIKLRDLDKLVAPTLIVDDVIDSGITLSTVKNYLNLKGVEHKIAALFCKPNATIKPDYYIHKTERWIQFPWE